MASVDFESVTKVFDGGAASGTGVGALAVDDFSLHVDDGELMVLVGPSGCGKSTVLRLLAGLEDPTGGTIRIGAQVVNALTPQQRNVAMVFQDYALYPFMDVRKNIEFPLKMRRMAAAEMERRVDAMAQLLSLAPLLGRLPKQLSGGQRQRVAMARALVREPAVSLLDEPLSNLDAKLRVQVRAEIAELQHRIGTTMLYVTHDQVEAMTLGQRVAVLQQGKLQQVAAPRELYERPANVFVAGFIGNPPMNLIATSLRRVDGGAAVSIGAHELRLPPNRADGLSAGSAVTVGVRPEALSLADAAGGPAVAVTVRYVEYLGYETLVYSDLTAPAAPEPIRLIARLPGMHSFAAGAVIQLRLDPEDLHLFDGAGKSVSAKP